MMSETCTVLSLLLLSSCLAIRFFSNSLVNSRFFRISIVISHLCYFNPRSNRLDENRHKHLVERFMLGMLELSGYDHNNCVTTSAIHLLVLGVGHFRKN